MIMTNITAAGAAKYKNGITDALSCVILLLVSVNLNRTRVNQYEIRRGNWGIYRKYLCS